MPYRLPCRALLSAAVSAAAALAQAVPPASAADRDGVPCLTPEERDQELHLLYVAATRARRGLEPNAAVRGCLAGRDAPVPRGEPRAAAHGEA